MSRTNRGGGSASPVKKYVNFKGSKGQFAFYDKNSTNDDKNVYLDSIDFVLVDVRSSITGFNESSSSQISSNLLDPYKVGKEPFTVKTKINGSFDVFAKGIWKDIKAEVDSIGGKFTSNLFALADVGDGMELVRIELSGASLTPWIEYQNTLSNSEEVYDQILTVGRGQLCTRKKGKTVAITDEEYEKILADIKKNPLATRPVLFYETKFEGAPITVELAELASDSDGVLQSYFNDAVSASTPTEKETSEAGDASQYKAPTPPSDSEGDEKDDLPF